MQRKSGDEEIAQGISQKNPHKQTNQQHKNPTQQQNHQKNTEKKKKQKMFSKLLG